MKALKSCLSRRRFLEAGGKCLGAASALSLLRQDTALAQEIPDQITSMSASQLSSAIRAQQVSCVEVMRAYLDRIHRYNPPGSQRGSSTCGRSTNSMRCPCVERS